ncbi:MAG: NCS2 family permease [Puniceicoccaceae bacterium]
MKWFVRGDVDGLFALGLNNFINFLLIINLSIFVLGFDISLVVERMLPAMAVGILFGNAFYAWQAKRLGARLGRSDITALPYGINLLPVFFFTFYVMLPAQQIALATGLTKAEADVIAWQAGILACFGSGIIEIIGSFFVHHLRRIAPRAAMLSALAAVGIFFIAADYCFRTYAYPEIGIPALVLTLYFFYGGAKLKGNLPGGLLIITFGVLVAWLTYAFGIRSPIDALGASQLSPGLYLPQASGFASLSTFSLLFTYLAVILPMGLLNVIGSMQVIESASAAGDDFPPKPTLIVNGIGTLLAGGLGSPFPTTLYIGHLGMKQIGAGAGYSLLNGLAMAFLCFSGTLGILSQIIPIEAGMAILIWIGLTIGSQAFQAVPERHAPAVVLGLIPGIGAFTALIIKRVMSSLGYGSPESPYSTDLFASMTASSDLFAVGVFALEQGWLYCSIVLTAILVAIIDRDLRAALGWTLAGAGLAFVGIIHGYQVMGNDIATKLGPALPWTFGYLLAAGLLFITHKYLVSRKTDPTESIPQPEESDSALEETATLSEPASSQG